MANGASEPTSEPVTQPASASGEAGQSRCPKCSHKRKNDADACARCGLVFALWTPAMAADVAVLGEAGEALWAEAKAAWQDDEKHDAFLKHCSAGGLLAVAGRRYRERLDETPGDAVATRMQERVLSMATLTYARPSTPPVPVTRTKWFWIVLGGVGVAGALAALALGR